MRCLGLAFAHIDRRKRSLLVNVGNAFAHEFECRCKTRRKYGRAQRWLHHIFEQVGVDRGPVGRLAHHALKRLARLRQGPDLPFGKMNVRQRQFLALLRIGRQQVIDRRRPFWQFDVGDVFRLATVKLHTAAAASDARIPGLERDEAARLRDRLAALGEAKAAGL